MDEGENHIYKTLIYPGKWREQTVLTGIWLVWYETCDYREVLCSLWLSSCMSD